MPTARPAVAPRESIAGAPGLGRTPTVNPFTPRGSVAGPTPTISGAAVAGGGAGVVAPRVARPTVAPVGTAVAVPRAYSPGVIGGSPVPLGRSRPGGTPVGVTSGRAVVVPPGSGFASSGAYFFGRRSPAIVGAPGVGVVGGRGAVVVPPCGPVGIARPCFGFYPGYARACRVYPPVGGCLPGYGNAFGFGFGYFSGAGYGYPVYEPYPVPAPYPVYPTEPEYFGPPAPSESYSVQPPLEGVAGAPVPQQELSGQPGEAFASQVPATETTEAAPAPAPEQAAPAETAPQQNQNQAAAPAPAPPSSEFQKLMQNGVDTFAAGSYEKAARTFLQAAMMGEGNVDSWLAYAVARFASGDFEMSALAVRRGVRMAPDVVNADFDLRERYGKAEDFPQQLKALDTHVLNNPSDSDGWLVLGFIRHFCDQRDLARRAFEVVQNRFADDADLAKFFLEAKGPATAPGQPAPAPNSGGQVAPGSSENPTQDALAAENALRAADLVEDSRRPEVDVLEQ